jgi:hypothetical protein
MSAGDQDYTTGMQVSRQAYGPEEAIGLVKAAEARERGERARADDRARVASEAMERAEAAEAKLRGFVLTLEELTIRGRALEARAVKAEETAAAQVTALDSLATVEFQIAETLRVIGSARKALRGREPTLESYSIVGILAEIERVVSGAPPPAGQGL